MSDWESDLIIDVKSDDFSLEDHPVPSTSSQSKLESDKQNIYVEEFDSGVSENNEDSDSETGEHCAICLSLIRGKIGSPDAEGCEHYFCLLCILEWTKTSPTCPQDRRPFQRILVRENICGEVISTLEANKSKADDEIFEIEDLTYCEVCGSCEREDCLLLCDGCDLGFHLECLSPPLSQVPIEEWFCPLCVAADLPQAIKKAESPKKIEKESKNQRKEKKRKRKPRMIPRTRASERVLRRINKTRNKVGKKRQGRDNLDDEEIKSDFTVHIKRAKPYGRISDSDIDAAFNEDIFADKILSSSSSSLSSTDKKDIAVKTLSDTTSVPLPSYSGRSSHSKLKNCQTANPNTDLLINILEEQDTLLSGTKDVSLTKERKLIKKEGAKSLEFNLDRENRVMSKLLPSQKKALESHEKEVKTDREVSRDTSRDSKDRKYEEKNKTHKDNFSNGHSSSYKHSYSSSRKSKNKDSYSSYKSKSYRNNDRNLDRRYDQDYRNKDMRRIDEKIRNWEKKEEHRKSGDYYDRRRSRRSRSKSWERKRIEKKHKRRSKTPERYKDKGKKNKNHLPTSSFWGKSFVDTFADCEFKSDSSDGNISFHTPEILPSSQKNETLYNISNTSEQFPDKMVNLSETEELSTEICSSVSTHPKNIFCRSEWEEKLEASHSPLKCDNNKNNNLIEEKRKLEGNDHRNEAESKKQRLKSLFGDEESDLDSPIDHPKFDSSVNSNIENIKKVLQKETLRRDLKSENGQILNTEENTSLCFDEVLRVDHGQNILSKSPASTICITSPSYSCENAQDGLGDITTLSKSSRDFVLKSLFGNRETENQEKEIPTKIENKESNFTATAQSMVDLEKRKTEINNKNIDNVKDIHTLKNNFDSSLVVEPIKVTDKTNKIFSHLFGDSSDSEASNSAVDKNSGKTTSKEISKGYCEQQKTSVIEKDPQNSSESKLVQKPSTPDASNKIVKYEIEKKNKLNNEGTQELDSKSSILPNKAKVNKLQLEMKVVDETKKFLNPLYLEKGFSKQIYKEIVSKCVNKVLEVESGNTVDPKKIQKLVNGYVQVYMHRNKKNTSNTSSSAPPPKPIV